MLRGRNHPSHRHHVLKNAIQADSPGLPNQLDGINVAPAPSLS